YLQRRLKLDLPSSGAHETMGKRKNGSLFPLEFVVSSMHVGSRHLFIATLRDISERKAHTDALEYQALHDALTGPPTRSLFGDQMVETVASIGIALYPVHGDDPGTLLRRADVAMYVAKRSGGGCSLYAPEQEAQSLRRSGLAGELRRSIPQGEMTLHYQPQVLLGSGTVYSVEALVRWNHPREGLMPPDRFIPMTEETGVIHPLTAW